MAAASARAVPTPSSDHPQWMKEREQVSRFDAKKLNCLLPQKETISRYLGIYDEKEGV